MKLLIILILAIVLIAGCVNECNCGSWTNGVCGAGGCLINQRQQIRTCTPSGCDVTSQCVADAACASNCSDGTAYGSCSATQPQYCDNGNLAYRCDLCGCPSGTCQSDGTCNLTSQNVERWAVIIDAEPFGPSGFDLIKERLIEGGWQEDHIKYLVGNDATPNNFTNALNWLANNSKSTDIDLIVSYSHGGATGIGLNGDTPLMKGELAIFTYSDFGALLDNIKYKGMGIVLIACEANNAVSYLKKENRVIAFPLVIGQMNRALKGFGDSNKDGWVSLEEMYNFEKVSNQNLIPMEDDYPGDLNIVYLNNRFLNLDQYNMQNSPISGLPVGERLENQNSWLAQSFEPNYPILTKVMLDLDRQSSGVGPLTVSIRKDLSGNDLASVTLPQESFPYIENFSSPKIYEFDFPDIEVIPGETYYIVIRAPSAVWQGNSGKSTYILTFNENYYPYGELFTSYDSGLDWQPMENDTRYTINSYPPYTNGGDLFFATFGESAISH